MSLKIYFILNFQLIQYHKWSLSEIENLIPWEREIYSLQLKQHLSDEKARLESLNH